MTPQPKRSETARSSIEPSDIASDYRSVLENAPGGSATSPHDPTRDLAVLSRPLPHPIDRTRSAFDVPGPEAPPPLELQPGPAFSTPPNLSTPPTEESPEAPDGDPMRVKNGATPAGTFSFSSSYYLAYRDLIQLPEWKLDRPTYEIVKAQVRGDARLSRQERTDLAGKLSCPYCGYSDLHHGPSRDCTGRE